MSSPDRHQSQAQARFAGTHGVILEDGAYGARLAGVLQLKGAASVLVCHTGEAARRTLAAHAVAWALIDTRLGDAEDGLAVADWLRTTYPTVARISHAAFAPSMPAEAPDMPTLFHAVVTKPCAVDGLVMAIGACLASLAALRGTSGSADAPPAAGPPPSGRRDDFSTHQPHTAPRAALHQLRNTGAEVMTAIGLLRRQLEAAQVAPALYAEALDRLEDLVALHHQQLDAVLDEAGTAARHQRQRRTGGA